MLSVKTEMMIDKMDKVMEKFKAKMTLDDMMNMESDDLALLKESMELYEMSCEIAVKQAKVIERIDKTTQELLEINKQLLLKANGLA